MTTQTKKDLLRAEAKKLMWEYYSENKASLPKWIRECREEILAKIVNGQSPVDVFESVVNNVG